MYTNPISGVFLPLAVPDAPGAPVVSGVTATTCQLSWTSPEYDGGSAVIGYFVERQSNISPRWIRINKSAVNDTSLPVNDLVEGTEYIFRAIAINKKGESKPSLPSENTLAKNPIGKLKSINLKNLYSYCKVRQNILCSVFKFFFNFVR